MDATTTTTVRKGGATIDPEHRRRATLCAAAAFASPYFFATVNLGVLWIVNAVAPQFYATVGSTVMLVNATLGIAVASVAGAMTPGPVRWQVAAAVFWTLAAAGVSALAAIFLLGTVGRAMGLPYPF